MNPSFSLYLDLVRFGAACLVYLYHSNMRLLVQDILPASHYGHSSVIVFFVLSGFVIAYVNDVKERHWVVFAASRLSRVYSVVLPTLLLTPLLDTVGRSLMPALYQYPFDRFALRLIGSSLMFNEVWFTSITFLSNVPYWSIAFEFWYYLLFALVAFLPAAWRWWAGGGVLILLGPKIALLLPIWAAGVVLYRWHWLQRRSRPFSWCLVLVSTLGIALTHHWGVYELWSNQTERWLGADRFRELTFARFFLGDYLLCALVFMNFAGMRNVAGTFSRWLLPVERPVRLLASYTFTLYLLHQPLFLFWAAVLRGDPKGHLYWWSVTILSALSIGAIGYFTENKRVHLRLATERGLQWLDARLFPRTGSTSNRT